MLHCCLVFVKSYNKIHTLRRLSCSLLTYGTAFTGWCRQGCTPRSWRVCSYFYSMFNFHLYIHCWFARSFHVAIDRNQINQLYAQLNIESQLNRESQLNIESLIKVKKKSLITYIHRSKLMCKFVSISKSSLIICYHKLF